MTSDTATARRPQATEVGSVFISNYPPYSFWSEGALAELEGRFAAPPRPDVPLGLYLHVPFCRRRCKFCYFRVYIDKNAAEIRRYLDAMGDEVERLAARPAVAGRRPAFVYFGGGTPSYIAVKHLEALVARLTAVLPWDAAEEITFECEPGTLTQAKVEAIRDIGVTRLSLGVESFDDAVLRENGRAHLSEEIDRCLPWIAAAGFEQLNVDLIAGMVGERWESWKRTVARTLELAPDSVTIYQMELPYNTIYSQGILTGEGAAPVADWETKRAWNDYAIDTLTAAGYRIASAYTLVRGDKPCRFVYRDALWHGADMLGVGVSSFGHMSGMHYQNVAGWGEYLGRLEAGELPWGRAFATNDAEGATRELLLQMKLGAVDGAYFKEKYGIDVRRRHAALLEELQADGLLRVDGERIELTRRGLLQVDALLPGFYDEKYRGARYT